MRIVSYGCTVAGGATFYGHFFSATKSTGRSICITPSCIPATRISTPSATSLGIDRIAEYAQLAGIGKKTGIDLPDEKEG